jgi:hypothetical protein
MFSFLTGSQNLELYVLIILLLISALPLDTIFVNMWLVFFISALCVFIVGKLGSPDLVFFSNPKDFMYDPDYNTWKAKNAPEY